jgi:hypothetical protein
MADPCPPTSKFGDRRPTEEACPLYAPDKPKAWLWGDGQTTHAGTAHR